MKRCLVTGSFDPFTIGHFDLVRRAANLFDVVYVAVLENVDKQNYFSKTERIAIVEKSVENLANVKVVGYDGWAIGLADTLQADYLVRGIRNEKDSVYEHKMAEYNKMHGDKETICFFTEKKYINVSSTEVKNKLKEGKDIGEEVVIGALELIEELYKGRQ